MKIIIDGIEYKTKCAKMRVDALLELAGYDPALHRLISIHSDTMNFTEYVCLMDYVDLFDGMTFTVR